MRSRVFAFLLVLYTAMDFANPLMAGAVTFTDGAITVVHADRPDVGNVAPDPPSREQQDTIEPPTPRLAAPVQSQHRKDRRTPVCRSALARPSRSSDPTPADH
jgi:hypothetical protein